MAEAFKDYGVEYGHDGARWSLTVPATSPEDAMARVRAAAAFGHCYTPAGIAMEIPAVTGPWLPRLVCGFLNLLKR